ncbi:MAG TPA: T9SS type A sorting domain-containing protein [Bacteroidota bacterium]|nr:T9SS type A sorting domain-containing protein [Bacteroidota bacterium]
MSKLFVVCVAVISLAPSIGWAWGGTGHKLINRNAVIHLPASMQQMIDQKSFLELHASDADTRKSVDPTEDVKHFIDIDVYPNFRNLILKFDSLAAVYGSSYVTNEGTLPWATKTTVDSLTAQFRRADWAKAWLTASDLGHYVGDGHQPLHLTKNYDGKLTGNSGIHSRYETSMLNTYSSTIRISRDSVQYVADPISYVFNYINVATVYTDSIMKADSESKLASGGSYSSTYYSALWSRTGVFTTNLLQQATVDLASLWYTAWIDAGLLYNVSDVDAAGGSAVVHTWKLSPAYPNPFNPSTTLRFELAGREHVRLTIYDALGRQIAMLLDEDIAAGTHALQWNASGIPSGVYFCRMSAGSHLAVQKLLLQR